MNSSESNNSLNCPVMDVNIGQLILQCEKKGNIFCSFELIARENEEFYERFFTEMKLKNCNPLFYALTWQRKSPDDVYLPLKLKNKFPINTLLHLTCRGVSEKNMREILDEAFKSNMTNILALRGDEPHEHGDFEYAIDLVKFIKKNYGGKFSIGVAGYPDTHPESESKETDLYHLRQKVDAGADFIITQIIFDSKSFINFVKDCRNFGIKVPIIPGILPITNYKSLTNLARICSLKLPENLSNDLEKIQDDDQAVELYGINLAVKISKEIISSRQSRGIHFFTFNKWSFAQKFWSHIINSVEFSPQNFAFK